MRLPSGSEGPFEQAGDEVPHCGKQLVDANGDLVAEFDTAEDCEAVARLLNAACQELMAVVEEILTQCDAMMNSAAWEEDPAQFTDLFGELLEHYYHALGEAVDWKVRYDRE